MNWPDWISGRFHFRLRYLDIMHDPRDPIDPNAVTLLAIAALADLASIIEHARIIDVDTLRLSCAIAGIPFSTRAFASALAILERLHMIETSGDIIVWRD